MFRGLAVFLLLVLSPHVSAETGALFGAAAVTGAVGSMVTPAIQANADVNIAAMQNYASVEQTRILADTARYNGDITRDIALGTASIAAGSAMYAQDSVTNRLGMQLDALAQARQEAYALQREDLARESYFQQQQLDLQRQMLATNAELTRMSLGLEGPFVNANSAASLLSSSSGNLGLDNPANFATSASARLLSNVGSSNPPAVQTSSPSLGAFSNRTNRLAVGSTSSRRFVTQTASRPIKNAIASFAGTRSARSFAAEEPILHAKPIGERIQSIESSGHRP